MRDLIIKEIYEVHGGLPVLGPVAVGAIAGGIWGGAAYLTGGPGFAWSGLGLAVASGAIGGGIAGMGGFAFAFYGGGLGVTGGISANQMRYVNMK